MVDFPPISQALATTPIAKFMHKQVFYALKNTTIRLAMQTMITHRVSGLPVVDNNLKCVGVYSELDAILQGASQNLDSPIRFSSPPLHVHVDDIFREVLVTLVKHKVKRLPVLDSEFKLMGVVSRSDLMRAFFEDVEQSQVAPGFSAAAPKSKTKPEKK